MRFARPLLVASALALFVSACSTPGDLAAPALEPQFGSPRDDFANAVTADAERGRVYVAGEYTGPQSTDRGDVVFFRRYDRGGRLVWKVCANAEARGVFADVAAAATDPAGNVYFAWSTSSPTRDPDVRANRGYLSKYSPGGRLLFRKELPNETLRGLTTDASGNLYATARNYATDDPYRVRKYTSGGGLVWAKVLRQESFPDGLVSVAGLDVGPDGSVFVAAEGFTGALLLKLRGGDGRLLTTSPVTGDYAADVEVAGGSVYAYSVLDSPFHFEPRVSRFRPDGTQVWARRGFFESDNTFDNLRYDSASGGISADARGNVYLAGAFVIEKEDGTSDGNVLVRKYTPAGGVAYDRRFTDPATQASARGVAALSGSELYVVGSTDGRVNGKNNGGRDAFLARLDGQGQKVWER